MIQERHLPTEYQHCALVLHGYVYTVGDMGSRNNAQTKVQCLPMGYVLVVCIYTCSFISVLERFHKPCVLDECVFLPRALPYCVAGHDDKMFERTDYIVPGDS